MKRRIAGYARYFEEAFGTPEIAADRVAKSIADYERTRLSGNSPWDRWRAGDERAVSEQVKQGHELFFGNHLSSLSLTRPLTVAHDTRRVSGRFPATSGRKEAAPTSTSRAHDRRKSQPAN
ncbi:MAG: cytochrome-c peroxidase [Acidobacteria bacterium]|nr:cytochrome-c peroxidase [Acidobacteriota bacterium]